MCRFSHWPTHPHSYHPPPHAHTHPCWFNLSKYEVTYGNTPLLKGPTTEKYCWHAAATKSSCAALLFTIKYGIKCSVIIMYVKHFCYDTISYSVGYIFALHWDLFVCLKLGFIYKFQYYSVPLYLHA